MLFPRVTAYVHFGAQKNTARLKSLTAHCPADVGAPGFALPGRKDDAEIDQSASMFNARRLATTAAARA